MKICFVGHGRLAHIQPYIDYFVSAGHDVHFVAITPSTLKNVKIHKAWFGKQESYASKFSKIKYLLSAFAVRRVLRKINPDVVHGHYVTSAGIALILCRHRNVIITAHGSDVYLFNGRIGKSVLKLLLTGRKKLHVVSNSLKEELIRVGFSARSIGVVNLGIDYDRFFRLRDVTFQHHMKIVCTRNFDRIYFHDTIIDALRIIKQWRVRFTMLFVGQGSEKCRLQKKIEDLSLTDSLQIIDYVSNDEMPNLLSKFDLYISSAKSDGTSLSLLEALAAGLFPVVSDSAANREWITHNVNGLLFPFDDSQSLAKSLLRISIGEFVVTPDIIRKNQELVFKRGNRQSNMEKVANIYRQ